MTSRAGPSVAARRLAGALVLVGLAGCASAPPPAPVVAGDGMTVWGAFDYGWSVREPGGPVVPLERYRGRVVVLNLWATWCPPCVAELGSLERLGFEVADLDVALLLVSPEDPGTVEAFQRRHGLLAPLLVEDTRAPESLGPLVLPTTFIIDREGRIVLRHRGASTWDDPEIVAFVRALAEEGA